MASKELEQVQNGTAASSVISDLERVEMGLNLAKQMDRPHTTDLRILIFTATYFVLDGVTLTIRRIESFVKSQGIWGERMIYSQVISPFV